MEINTLSKENTNRNKWAKKSWQPHMVTICRRWSRLSNITCLWAECTDFQIYISYVYVNGSAKKKKLPRSPWCYRFLDAVKICKNEPHLNHLWTIWRDKMLKKQCLSFKIASSAVSSCAAASLFGRYRNKNWTSHLMTSTQHEMRNIIQPNNKYNLT